MSLHLIIRILQIPLGASLFYWGYINLENMEAMEYRFVEEYLGNWFLAPVLARLFIGLKWTLGLFFILNIKPSRGFLIGLTTLVAIHGYDLWADLGSTPMIIENYSVFDQFPIMVVMSLLMLLAAFGIYLFKVKKYSDLSYSWIKYIPLLACVITPFILNAIFPADLSDETEELHYAFKSELIDNTYIQELTAGEALICFYSTSCPFCVRSARKIAVAQKRYPDFPEVFICFQGNHEGAEYFLEIAELKINYTVLPLALYEEFSSQIYPQFQLIHNKTVQKKWDGQSFNFSVMNSLSTDTPF